MNLKLFSGIFLPLIVSVFLIVISTNELLISTDVKTEQSVPFYQLFSDKADPILIQTITVHNHFFLSQNYIVPKVYPSAYNNDKAAYYGLNGHISLSVPKISETNTGIVAKVPAFSSITAKVHLDPASINYPPPDMPSVDTLNNVILYFCRTDKKTCIYDIEKTKTVLLVK